MNLRFHKSITHPEFRIEFIVLEISIYIKKKVCLSVRYAFPHRTSKCDQTFQGASSHPEEGQ
jgi:hypothetical protein